MGTTDNGIRAERFTTLDAYISGFLCIHGFVPDLIQEGPRVVFAFESGPELLKAIASYNAGATVPASQLALATKALKSQIHSMRRDKELCRETGLKRQETR